MFLCAVFNGLCFALSDDSCTHVFPLGLGVFVALYSKSFKTIDLHPRTPGQPPAPDNGNPEGPPIGLRIGESHKALDPTPSCIYLLCRVSLFPQCRALMLKFGSLSNNHQPRPGLGLVWTSTTRCEALKAPAHCPMGDFARAPHNFFRHIVLFDFHLRFFPQRRIGFLAFLCFLAACGF